ncbi:RNA-binding protein [Ligilactobacillus sp. WILCCON 0076]|uniref:RNA-binding protein n=1 Tax=Ligilactobacillus ubinensis TaxID=2876789 RepID=A0A9X2FJ94_9LACO|nr:YlmH/Sll1252 family protein [Ligilactobacillus ubinensis]MCP0886490.1 RNA-binding protein [Ligilactobacillus ubinensis]
MKNEQIYQHFRNEEEPLIDELLSLIARAENEYRPVLTPFLNPRECYIAKSILGQNDNVKASFYGGAKKAERQRILFYPVYFEVETKDFNISLVEIEYPIKFATLKHGQILGTLANAGVKYDVLGDILTDGQRWQFFVQNNMVSFFLEQVTQIGRIKVRLREIDMGSKVNTIDAWENETTTVSSLRIDGVVSNCYHISRQHTKALIKAHKIHVNWMQLEKPDYMLESYDIISVRGYGRIRLNEVSGISKKGKLRLDISVLRK